MDKNIIKQIKSVIKGIAIFDIVVIIALGVHSKIAPVENTIISNALNLNISAILGLLVGSLVSIFNFYMLASSTENMVNQAGKTMVQLKFVGGYFLRFMIYAVVLFISAKLDSISMFTAVLGLLSTQIVLLVQKTAAIFMRKEA